MVADLARSWWLLALRGVVGILFGIGSFVWPGASLTALVIFLGAYALVDGVFAVGTGIGMRQQMDRWWLLVLEGVAGIILGILTFVSPAVTVLVVLSFVAAWAILTGVFEVVAAVRLRTLIENEWLLIASGIVSILCGILTLVLSLRMRGMLDTSGRQLARPGVTGSGPGVLSCAV